MTIIILLVLIGICAWFIYENVSLKNDNKALQNKLVESKEENARVTAKNENLEENLKQSKKGPDDLKTIFENLANKIFEDKTSKFKTGATEQLNTILNPLKEKIKEFREDIDSKYSNEEKERFSLKEEIKKLTSVHETLDKETKSLTEALKSDPQKQGTWGEIKLERVLELSGLQRGIEYKTQVELEAEDGNKQRPDAIVYLPDKKQIIIDAKVSLKPYWDYLQSDSLDNEELKNNLFSSVKSHIDTLSEKEYHRNTGLNSPYFTVLFFPLEGALSVVMDMNVPNQNTSLLNYAWDKSIIIVTPSNLMATLKVISSMWMLAKQELNAMEIAEQSGNLYDKFVGFIDDLTDIRKHLDKTVESYEKAENKLHTGRGSLVSRSEKIKKLGVKTKKSIPDDWKTDVDQIEE